MSPVLEHIVEPRLRRTVIRPVIGRNGRDRYHADFLPALKGHPPVVERQLHLNIGSRVTAAVGYGDSNVRDFVGNPGFGSGTISW